jgi:subtilisin family serine protease
VRRLSLDDPPFAAGLGSGVTIAIVDSGVHASHPHVEGSVIGGACVLPGHDSADWVDRLGHGTAVAAAIHEKAPLAQLLAVRVFDRSLVTSAQALADGIRWSAEHGAQLINLSLGTANAAHGDLLAEAVAYASACGARVVSAREWNGQRWLPGSLDGVIGVLLDADCPRDQIRYPGDGDDRDGGDHDDDEPGSEPDAGERAEAERTMLFAASGYPRPIPGVPAERNLSGISFAVANVTGFLARVAAAQR